MNDLIIIGLIFINIFLIDCLSIFLSNLINPVIKNLNTRWFFIHAYMNLCVTYYSIPSFTYCLQNIGTCHLIKWTDDSYFAFWFTIIPHIYHMIFFTKYLKYSEWFHHITMCVICSPMTYFLDSIVTDVALLFICGIPGLIDYLLLWLVKLDIFSKKYEKLIYVYISVLIRSPGILFSIFLGIPAIINSYHEYNYLFFFLSLSNMVFSYWNAQYYMAITCRDASKKNIL